MPTQRGWRTTGAVLLVLVGVFAAACGSGDAQSNEPIPPVIGEDAEPDSAESDSRPPGDEADAPPTSDTPEATAGDRLVVQSVEGVLTTMTPDGSDAIVLSSEDTVNRQPVWSPDAGHIAWVEIDDRTLTPAVISDRFDRSDRTDLAVDEPAFYLSWNSSSNRILVMQPGISGIEVLIADLAVPDIVTLDHGQPYYASWSPDGDALLVHASNFRLDRVEVDGTTVIIEDFPGPFQAPSWSSDQRALVYADEVDVVPSLVSTGIDGEGRLPILTYDGHLVFVVNPDNSRVAALASPEPIQADGDVITTSLPVQDPEPDPTQPDPAADPATDTPPIESEALVVTSIYGGLPVTVAEKSPVVAFFWSPDGTTLAYLVEQRADDADRNRLRWHFWQDGLATTGATFTPSEVFSRDYLPFFDQYAQSVRFFSPDSSALVYAGSADGEPSGIWIQALEPGAVPQRIADGVFAAWSPDTAGSAGSDSR